MFIYEAGPKRYNVTLESSEMYRLRVIITAMDDDRINDISGLIQFMLEQACENSYKLILELNPNGDSSTD